jgi:hypothetical protein
MPMAVGGAIAVGKALKAGADRIGRYAQAFREGSVMPVEPLKPTLPGEPVKPTKDMFPATVKDVAKPNGEDLSLPAKREVPLDAKTNTIEYFRGHVDQLHKLQQDAFGGAIDGMMTQFPKRKMDITKTIRAIATQMLDRSIDPSVTALVNKSPTLKSMVNSEFSIMKGGGADVPPIIDKMFPHTLTAKQVQPILSKMSYATKTGTPMNQEGRLLLRGLSSEAAEAFPELSQARKEYSRFMTQHDELSGVSDEQILKASAAGSFNPTAQTAANRLQLPSEVKDVMNNYKTTVEKIDSFNNQIDDVLKNGTKAQQEAYRIQLEKNANALEKQKLSYQIAMDRYSKSKLGYDQNVSAINEQHQGAMEDFKRVSQRMKENEKLINRAKAIGWLGAAGATGYELKKWVP